MNLATPSYLEQFAAEVRHSLSLPGQRELPSKYFYDELGSALFEAITLLPEYGLTRASERLLAAHAPSVMGRLPGPLRVAELGCGSGKRTRHLLEAVAARGGITYCPIEISGAALARCELELGQVRGVTIVGCERSYLEGLESVLRARSPHERVMVLFLGSSVGNFDRPAADSFLRQVRALLQPGDGLLLETDLVKDRARLLAAYADPLGLTAAFNLNLLARLNRELGADFDLAGFEHLAVYNELERRIEMHLRSLREQLVRIPAADLELSLRAGETLWTENSHKYILEELAPMAARTGFEAQESWVDEEWPFAQSLWLAAANNS